MGDLNGWVRCSERMPEPDKTVIIWNGHYIGFHQWSSNRYHKKPRPSWRECISGKLSHFEPTHWMPLPAPPCADGEAGKGAGG